MRPSFRLSALPPTLRALLADPPLSTSLTVNGWLKSVRAHKNVAFGEVSDGSGGGLQAVWKGKGRADGYVTKRVVPDPRQTLDTPGAGTGSGADTGAGAGAGADDTQVDGWDERTAQGSTREE
jgi:hypothetical protein